MDVDTRAVLDVGGKGARRGVRERVVASNDHPGNLWGFPILWFGTKDTSLKFVAKYWHAWPSIAMAILVFAHTIPWWVRVRPHWYQAKAVTG